MVWEKKMINNYVVPSYTPASTLSVGLFTNKGIYDLVAYQAKSAKDASWTITNQYPSVIKTNIDTFVVLKGASSSVFPGIACYGKDGVYQNATVFAGQVLIFPVNYTQVTTSDTIYLHDGNESQEITVSASDYTITAGTFAITTMWANRMQINVEQYIAVEGTGLNNVSTITDPESNELEFWPVDDTWLIIKTHTLSSSGSKTFTFKNSGGTTLGTSSLTFYNENELNNEACFWYDGDRITVSVKSLDSYTAIINVSGTLYQALSQFESLETSLNRLENDYLFIVRDKLGKVISYAEYSILKNDGTTLFHGTANKDGVIQIAKSLLPSEFTLQLDRFDVPVRREYIVL